MEAGNREQARAEANAALKLAPNRDVQAIAALALARAGDTAAAEKLAAELDKKFPLDTLVQRYWLPTIRAAVALERKDPNQAVELLQGDEHDRTGSAHEVSRYSCAQFICVEKPISCCTTAKRRRQNFRSSLTTTGWWGTFPGARWPASVWLALTRSMLRRCLCSRKARTAYQNFLTLWKDADPDIPIYKQAKAEYAKLH